MDGYLRPNGIGYQVRGRGRGDGTRQGTEAKRGASGEGDRRNESQIAAPILYYPKYCENNLINIQVL